MYNYKLDACAPASFVIGDGGNVEGLYHVFVDTPPMPKYCADPKLFKRPLYQVNLFVFLCVFFFFFVCVCVERGWVGVRVGRRGAHSLSPRQPHATKKNKTHNTKHSRKSRRS